MNLLGAQHNEPKSCRQQINSNQFVIQFWLHIKAFLLIYVVFACISICNDSAEEKVPTKFQYYRISFGFAILWLCVRLSVTHSLNSTYPPRSRRALSLPIQFPSLWWMALQFAHRTSYLGSWGVWPTLTTHNTTTKTIKYFAVGTSSIHLLHTTMIIYLRIVYSIKH